MDEPYIYAAPQYTLAEVVVPEGRYFLLGDNRNNSYDSHYGWTVERSEIIGKAWIRYWPPDKIGGPGNYPLDQQLEENGVASVLSGSDTGK